MLTERWPYGQMPRIAPQWRGDPADQRPTLVHLDTWCWTVLAKDRAGMRAGHADEGIYDFLRELAASGEAVFLLSQAHYQENRVRENADARWDSAVVMGELSGFNSLTPHALATWEAECAVKEFFGLDVEVETPNPFGWGYHWCVSGQESRWTIVDSATGRPADLAALAVTHDVELAALEYEIGLRMEFAALGLRDPTSELTGNLIPAALPAVIGQDFSDEQTRVSAAIDRYGRTRPVVENSVLLPALIDSLPDILLVADRLGALGTRLVDDLASVPPPERTDAIRKVVMSMPVQGPFTELRLRAHLKESFRWQPSDCMDFFAMATVGPFVDFIVADRRTYNLVNEGRIGPWEDTTVVRRLRDLRDALAQL